MSGGRCLWTKPLGLPSWDWAPGLQRPDKGERDVRIVEMSKETTADICILQGLTDFFFIINAGEGVEKREPSYTVGGNAN